jgi:hypothetical protein
MKRQDTNQRVRKLVSETALSALKMPIPYEKTYHGIRHTDGKVEVWVEEPVQGSRAGKAQRTLALHLELRNHSPTGFEWGYGGSGPAQLSLAILMDASNDPTLALRHYHDFKFQFVAGWDKSWNITLKEITSFLAARENLAGCQGTPNTCPDC